MQGAPGDADGFIVDKLGPNGIFGVFEDDGETGWLYLYEPDQPDAIRHARHVYNRSDNVAPTEGEVAVVWSEDFSKCGVIVWGKMRAIIHVASRRDHGVPPNDRRSPGVLDEDWLHGFQWA
jgi:hypothetical protein